MERSGEKAGTVGDGGGGVCGRRGGVRGAVVGVGAERGGEAARVAEEAWERREVDRRRGRGEGRVFSLSTGVASASLSSTDAAGRVTLVASSTSSS